MKSALLLIGLFLCFQSVEAQTLPVIITQPTNSSGSSLLSVVASGATSFQWRKDGVNISGATNSTLPTSGSGFYTVIVKNFVGWVPSDLVFVPPTASPANGILPFGNVEPGWSALVYDAAKFDGVSVISNATAQLVAGPSVDRMIPVGNPTPVANGYFRGSDTFVPGVAPGQAFYYRVDIIRGGSVQPSATLQVTGLAYSSPPFPLPLNTNLYFPYYLEWPEPSPNNSLPTATTYAQGENVVLASDFTGYVTPTGPPTLQWRKDGKLIGAPTNFTSGTGLYFGNGRLALPNIQAVDAGVYDTLVLGNHKFVGPKIKVIVQVSNIQNTLKSPRILGDYIYFDLAGLPGRRYSLQGSTNLVNWTDLQTNYTDSNGVSVVNYLAYTPPVRFFRTVLLP